MAIEILEIMDIYIHTNHDKRTLTIQNQILGLDSAHC